jgi:hypothetical protein
MSKLILSQIAQLQKKLAAATAQEELKNNIESEAEDEDRDEEENNGEEFDERIEIKSNKPDLSLKEIERPPLKLSLKRKETPDSATAITSVAMNTMKTGQSKNVFTSPPMVLTEDEFDELFTARVSDSFIGSLINLHMREFINFQKRYLLPLSQLGLVHIDLDDINGFDILEFCTEAKSLFTDGMLMKRPARGKDIVIEKKQQNSKLREKWLLVLTSVWLKLSLFLTLIVYFKK